MPGAQPGQLHENNLFTGERSGLPSRHLAPAPLQSGWQAGPQRPKVVFEDELFPCLPKPVLPLIGQNPATLLVGPRAN